MFSMCSELTPRARIPDTRIPQLMQPCRLPVTALALSALRGLFWPLKWYISGSTLGFPGHKLVILLVHAHSSFTLTHLIKEGTFRGTCCAHHTAKTKMVIQFC